MQYDFSENHTGEEFVNLKSCFVIFVLFGPHAMRNKESICQKIMGRILSEREWKSDGLSNTIYIPKGLILKLMCTDADYLLN